MTEDQEVRNDVSSTEIEPLSSDGDRAWDGLLQFIHLARGFDFQGYKPNTLTRRIQKRMLAVHESSFDGYHDYLEVHPEEFVRLFDTILINVTSFFRDPQAWEVVRATVIPGILGAKGPDEPVRVWSAGCASGEEAYTIAMLLAEEMGPEQYRDRVKIYATDVDEDALGSARRASYTARQTDSVPPRLLERYFEPIDGGYLFRKEFRRQVIFGRHDLVGDAPISRIDLLACRNTLMYFNAETQAQVLNRFHFALNPDGYLFLGRAETLMTQGKSFVPVDLKRRLSRKVSRRAPPGGLATRPDDDPPPEAAVHDRMHLAALEASPVAQLVVDAGGQVIMINDRARALFELRSGDAGRPLRDMQLSYRPVELRSIIERAEKERRPVTVSEIEWRPSSGEVQWLELQVTPIHDAAGPGYVITFTDVTAPRRLRRELEQSHQELETAYEELQSTNEELETTNEELQSTVEELETTNEELQSTNEELETMNEELQSTNEEFQTINDELRQRGDDLGTSIAFNQSVLASLRGGVAVVDRELRLLAWSRQAEELWGLRSAEVSGKHLLNLEIGLPVERLRPALKATLGGDAPHQQLLLEATNRRGKAIRCDVTCTPLVSVADEILGAILVMEESPDGRG